MRRLGWWIDGVCAFKLTYTVPRGEWRLTRPDGCLAMIVRGDDTQYSHTQQLFREIKKTIEIHPNFLLNL